jgi:hypothetical protein
MTDTPPHIRRLQAQIIRAKPLTTRICMVCEMADGGRDMVVRQLQRQHPDWTVGKLRTATFRRIYKNDFPPDELDRIATAMQAWYDKYDK